MRRVLEPWIALAGIALATLSPAAQTAVTPFKQTRMIIEFNSSADDIGVQFFLDADGWREIEILDPAGRELFSAEAEGRLLRQGGGTELFVESVEPSLEDLPLEIFFQRFPEGIYRFRGTDLIGGRITGQDRFTHDIPAGPEVTAPVANGGECAKDVPMPVTISWQAVELSIFDEPVNIVQYEVIVEGLNSHLDVFIPADGPLMLKLPAQVLQPRSDYVFEVLAIEASGNQTITEGCFSTR
jgi:hypothetical protein